MAYNTLELLYEKKQIPTNSVRPHLINSLIRAEKYNNLVECAELLPSITKAEHDMLMNEGFFDRLKARGSQALGAVKGAAQQVGGKIQNAAGGAVNAAGNLAANTLSKGAGALGANVTVDPSQNKVAQYGQNLQAQGQKNVQQGGQQGVEAKYQSYIKNSVSSIVNDLSKLGMDVKDPTQLSKDLNTALRRNLVGVNSRTGQLAYKTPGGGNSFGGTVA